MIDAKQIIMQNFSKEIKLKLEHQGKQATFLDLDFTIADLIFVNKRFEKKRYFSFPHFPHITLNQRYFIISFLHTRFPVLIFSELRYLDVHLD